MSRKKERDFKAGLPPGTLVYTGSKERRKVRITVMDYDSDNLTEKAIFDCSGCEDYRERPTVSWINMDGVHDAKKV